MADKPDQATATFMQQLAGGLDKVLNGAAKIKRYGFVLLVFRFGDAPGERTNYVSNAQRDDVTAALKEIVGRFEGRTHDESETVN